MGWPLSQDYNEAVQNPRTSFADPDLKAGEAVPGPLGLPLPRSGNFADVYQIRGADGRMWALKCFTRAAARLRERYVAIDAHLGDARLPFTVGFEFLTDGVRIRNLWYPALKMEWVEGLQLNEFVRRNVDRPEHLRAVLGVWVRLCKRLRDARIAHADLQHGNVLLVPGATAQRLKLRLIDYDGMWVPALAGKPSGEAGHPNYQHPNRLDERTYTPDVDRFPHLVIGCALRALAVAGQPLWDRFDNGDNLLFREADFADPVGSRLLRALWELDDPTVTNLVALLVVSAGRPLGDTPWLDEVLSGDRAVPVNDAVLARAAELLGVTRRSARRAVPTTQLFEVPEEANQFTEFGGSEWAPRRRRKASKIPLVLAGGALAAAVSVVAAVLSLRNDRPLDDAGPLPPTVVDNTVSPPVAARSGAVDTKWTNFPSAPRAPQVERLISGIDVAPPGTKAVRTYPVRGAAALGAWLRPGGIHAVIIGHTQLGDLDLATGKVNATPLSKAAGEPVRAVVTPDGRHVVTAGKDNAVRCLDVPTGRAQWTKAFPGAVTALAVTPDGERVAASGEKVGYIEWSIGDGSEVRRHESLQASLLAFSPAGSHAVAVNESGVELWSLDDGKATMIGPGFAATAICFTPNGEQALAAGAGRDVRAWAVADGRELPERPALLRQGVTTLGATADGTLLFGGPAGEVGYLGPDGTNAVFAFGPDSGPVVSFALTADGRHALVASEKGSVLLTRVADLVRPDGPSKDGPAVGALNFVRSTAIGPDITHFAADAAGTRVLTASGTHVRVLAAETLAAGRPLQVPGGGIVAIGAGPDDLVLVCQAVDDGFQTRTYDPGGGIAGPLFTLPASVGDPGRITRFVPVPGHTWVAATTDAAGDVLFDPATGKVVPGWPDPRPGDAAIAAPSPDGKLIAVGGNDRPIRLWTVDTQTAGPPLEGSAGVIALTFTPDGKALVGLWPLGRIRIWDPATEKFLKEVDHPYTGRFTEIAGLADGLVVLGAATGRLVLNLDTGAAINTGDGPDPLAGRGLAVPARGWILATDREERLTVWRVNAAQARRLTAKPPPSNPWPDVRVRRDAPVSPPVGLAFAADGQSVVVATEKGRLVRYTADRLLFAGEIAAEEAPLFGFARAGDRIFTIGRRSLVVARDADTLEKKFDIPSQAPGNVVPLLLAVSPDGSSVVISADKARLADVKTRKEVKTAALPVAAVGERLTQFAFSEDGRVSVGRWGDTITAVWNPKTGQPRVLEALPEAVAASPQGLALTPDGKVALLGTADGKLTAWDTGTGKELFSETIYPDARPDQAISAVTVLPGGTQFLTLGSDGRLIVWQLDGFRKAKEYHISEGPWRLAVAPDGRAVVMQKSGEILRIDLNDTGKREP